MPIKGFTDRGIAFPEIGRIRLGKKGKTAQGVEYPVDLDYFRVEFYEGDGQNEAAAAFLRAYPGGQPTVLRVLFPYNDLERNWDAYLEAWTASRLVARSDGEVLIEWVNTKDGRRMVRDGRATERIDMDLYLMEGGQAVVRGQIKAEFGEPVPYTENMVVGRDYRGQPVVFKPVGRLKVILPEVNRPAYLTLSTSSKFGIINLGGVSYDPATGERVYNGELGAIAVLCEQLGIAGMSGVPFLLSRRSKEIRYTEGGVSRRTTKALLHVEADPAYLFSLIRSKTLTTTDSPMLVSGTVDDLTNLAEDDEDEGFPWEEGQESQQETEGIA